MRSSQTRARTRVPCIGRQILNHCATREALVILYSSFPLPKTSKLCEITQLAYILCLIMSDNSIR